MHTNFETAAEEALQAILSSHFALSFAGPEDKARATGAFGDALDMAAAALNLLNV